MRQISQDQIDTVLDFPSLIDALAAAFTDDHVAPIRHHHELDSPTGRATHLIMPAWTADAPSADAFIGTKIVNVFSQNSSLGLASVMASYLLQSGRTGAPLAVMDGSRLTLWRTAAASALAAHFLARADASRLVMVGTGALAPFMIRAHTSVRPITRISVWNHRRSGAERLVSTLANGPWSIDVAADLGEAVAGADIVSCATLAKEPLVHGARLKPGVHVDLVGAYNLSMRECDDEALVRARIFIDTAAAKTEGGDVAIALQAGLIGEDDIAADLYDLCRHRRRGRTSAEEVTLFKSVGTAVEDLAAAMLVWRRIQDQPVGPRL